MSDISATKISIPNLLEALFGGLSQRERDVVTRRHKLIKGAKKRETLEKIGQDYQVTRERVRQIERDGLRKLTKTSQDQVAVKQTLQDLENTIDKFLKTYGGAMEEGHLLDKVVGFIGLATDDVDDVLYHKESLSFVIANLLSDKFEKVQSSNHRPSWKLKDTPWDLVDDVIEQLVSVLQIKNSPLKREEFLVALRQQNFYNQLADKLGSRVSNFERDLLNLDEAILAYAKTSKKIKENIFGHVGLSHWPTISPKRMKDKIYLVMQQTGKPLHFTEIAQAINDAGFDRKRALPATVHNELILDDRYILIGRGIYALKEWGYNSGTVADVIIEVLKAAGQPLTKEQIITEVNKQRVVKQATINLALMNKSIFKKLSNKTYELVQKAG